MIVRPDTTIEELVLAIPDSVKYLMEKGIRCLSCGEPIWGTLEATAREKGISSEKLAEIVADLNKL